MLFLAARIFFWIVGIMFFAGIIGSAIVVLFTSVEDAKELKGEEKPASSVVSSPHIARAQPSL